MAALDSERLVAMADWKQHARRTDHGYYELATDDIWGVPVRLFLTPNLLAQAEGTLYRQIVNATDRKSVV